ncbi:MAG: prepilin-type N-terminal cleavage/methylation domain-containing protein [Candidatus Saccharimonadales bacterium]
MYRLKKDIVGFTLIEVILVLAVGSLIFAMAFVAYGQASANRRDSQRRADLAKIAGELENYAADNNGKYPTYVVNNGSEEFKNFKTEYIPSLKDPSSDTPYIETIAQDGYASAAPGSISYYPENFFGLKIMTMCDGGKINGNNRDYVIRMKLEKGETCRDSRQ